MRLIDADLLKERLSGYLVKREFTELDEVRNAFVLNCIEETELSPTVNEWIPCSERLPVEFETRDGYIEPSDHVLIQDDCENLFVSRYWGHRITRQENGSVWIDLKYDRNIIAWQPLPKKYEVPNESK